MCFLFFILLVFAALVEILLHTWLLPCPCRCKHLLSLKLLSGTVVFTFQLDLVGHAQHRVLPLVLAVGLDGLCVVALHLVHTQRQVGAANVTLSRLDTALLHELLDLLLHLCCRTCRRCPERFLLCLRQVLECLARPTAKDTDQLHMFRIALVALPNSLLLASQLHPQNINFLATLRATRCCHRHLWRNLDHCCTKTHPRRPQGRGPRGRLD